METKRREEKEKRKRREEKRQPEREIAVGLHATCKVLCGLSCGRR
jgi:hypothetical protein